MVRSLTTDGYSLSTLVEQDTMGHLVALKLLARDDETRPQDAADLRALASVLGPQDQTTARTAVELIVERDFADVRARAHRGSRR